MNYENICLQWIMKKINVCLQYMDYENIIAIHESWKYLYAIHKLWKQENICLQYMNYKKIKMFVCNAWIMKIFCLQYMNDENIKMVCLQYTNYEKNENICCQYMNYKNICLNIWIMKKWKCSLRRHELWKKFSGILKLWKHENFVCKHELWRYENICLQ